MKGTILHTPKSIAFVKRIVKHLPPAVRNGLPARITVAAVSVREALALNRRYRKKHKPADVLSFFYGPEYGEIILCPSVIRGDAKTQGNSYAYQLTWMIVHGMMHLTGLHHERSVTRAKRVERTEQKILAQLFPRLSFPHTRESGRKE